MSSSFTGKIRNSVRMFCIWDIFQTQKGRCHCLAAGIHLGVSGVQGTFKAMNLVKKQLKDWSVGHFNTKRLGRVCVLCRSVVSDFLWPHGLQPERLLCPWGFSKQEYPPPGDLSNPEVKPRSPALQVDSLLSEPLGQGGVGKKSRSLRKTDQWGYVEVKWGWFKKIKYWWEDGVIHCIKFSQVRWEWERTSQLSNVKAKSDNRHFGGMMGMKVCLEWLRNTEGGCGDSEYPFLFWSDDCKWGQRNEGVAWGAGRVERNVYFQIYLFLMGEITTCLSASGNDVVMNPDRKIDDDGKGRICLELSSRKGKGMETST